jgi:chromosomal replication initiation ATPase DnaA
MSDVPRSLQLALSLPHAESFARDDFIAGLANAVALSLIDRWPDWPDRIVALVGPEGSGKSHLASIWAERAGARFLSARALPETDLPGALATGALVVEDIVPARLDETALFHLLNLAREERAYLLLTARTPPTAWPCSSATTTTPPRRCATPPTMRRTFRRR